VAVLDPDGVGPGGNLERQHHVRALDLTSEVPGDDAVRLGDRLASARCVRGGVRRIGLEDRSHAVAGPQEERRQERDRRRQRERKRAAGSDRGLAVPRDLPSGH
jgi:hypothetical protein